MALMMTGATAATDPKKKTTTTATTTRKKKKATTKLTSLSWITRSDSKLKSTRPMKTKTTTTKVLIVKRNQRFHQLITRDDVQKRKKVSLRLDFV